jgi:hypothetical protein
LMAPQNVSSGVKLSKKEQAVTRAQLHHASKLEYIMDPVCQQSVLVW